MNIQDIKRMQEILKLDLDKLAKPQLHKVLSDINNMIRYAVNGNGPEFKDQIKQFRDMVNLKPKILTLLKAPIQYSYDQQRSTN